MGARSILYTCGSIVLSTTFLAVGISFFGPFWLSNVGAANETTLQGYPYLPGTGGNMTPGVLQNTMAYPDRGLWAQCGVQCIWFWGDGHDYRLQKLFTPLKWHLATQVLYFIGAAIILFCEIISRVHTCCCREKSALLYSVGVAIFVSALIQTAAVATFGAGAARSPYNAISDPKQFTKYLGQAFFQDNGYPTPYLGWCYWMAVVGDMLSVVAGILFMLAACCGRKSDE
jgi:NADH:ubiquinone oxidoreductase subunit 6 (subunit J)